MVIERSQKKQNNPQNSSILIGKWLNPINQPIQIFITRSDWPKVVKSSITEKKYELENNLGPAMIIIEGDWLKLQCENPEIERFRGILRESSCCDGARKDRALGLGFVEQR